VHALPFTRSNNSNGTDAIPIYLYNVKTEAISSRHGARNIPSHVISLFSVNKLDSTTYRGYDKAQKAEFAIPG